MSDNASNGHREDPVVEEIRAIRRQMWSDGGGTWEGYAQLVKREAEAAMKEIRENAEGGSDSQAAA